MPSSVAHRKPHKTPNQKQQLLGLFAKDPWPTTVQMAELAKSTYLTEEQVHDWFRNRRRILRRKGELKSKQEFSLRDRRTPVDQPEHLKETEAAEEQNVPHLQTNAEFTKALLRLVKKMRGGSTDKAVAEALVKAMPGTVLKHLDRAAVAEIAVRQQRRAQTERTKSIPVGRRRADRLASLLFEETDRSSMDPTCVTATEALLAQLDRQPLYLRLLSEGLRAKGQSLLDYVRHGEHSDEDEDEDEDDDDDEDSHYDDESEQSVAEEDEEEMDDENENNEEDEDNDLAENRPSIEQIAEIDDEDEEEDEDFMPDIRDLSDSEDNDDGSGLESDEEWGDEVEDDLVTATARALVPLAEESLIRAGGRSNRSAVVTGATLTAMLASFYKQQSKQQSEQEQRDQDLNDAEEQDNSGTSKIPETDGNQSLSSAPKKRRRKR
eukprot:Clim_evm59s232 gene=Clim_evmTU59s232